MSNTPEINPLDVLGAGAGGPLPPLSPWSDFGSYLQYSKGIVIGDPSLPSMGVGTINAIGYYVNGTRFDFSSVVPIAGGTMTGPLILSGDPTANFQAATKHYVDTQISTAGNGRFLALTGGTLTGPLVLNADPTLPLGSSTKQYVDGRTPITVDAPNNTNYYVRYQNTWQIMPAGITIADAPSDGNTYARNNLAWTNIYDATAGSILRINRSYTGGVRPTGKSYGEPYVNFTDNEFGVIDSTGAARDLIGVPLYSTTANYAIGVSVAYGGRIYVSNQAVNAENPFNAAHWNLVPTVVSPAFTGTPTAPTAAPGTNSTQIASTAFVASAIGTGYVAKTGDTMTGNLTIGSNVSSGYAALVLNSVGGVSTAAISYMNNGTTRWLVQGYTPTSDYYTINRYNSSGGFAGTPIVIGQGVMTLGENNPGNIYAGGFQINMTIGYNTPSHQAGFACHQEAAGQTATFALFLNNASYAQVGNISFTDTATNYATSSDARFKQDKQPFTRGRDVIDQISIIDFEWTHTKERAIGLVAQDVHDAYPHAIVQGRGDPGDEDFMAWGVDYSKYVPLLIQALQDAHKRIDEVLAINKDLEERLTQLENGGK